MDNSNPIKPLVVRTRQPTGENPESDIRAPPDDRLEKEYRFNNQSPVIIDDGHLQLYQHALRDRWANIYSGQHSEFVILGGHHWDPEPLLSSPITTSYQARLHNKIVDHALESLCPERMYFYCGDNINSNSGFCSLPKLLKSLITQVDDIQRKNGGSVKESSGDSEQVDITGLCKTLADKVTGLPHSNSPIYCTIDRVDLCPPDEVRHILSTLYDITNEGAPEVKFNVFITENARDAFEVPKLLQGTHQQIEPYSKYRPGGYPETNKVTSLYLRQIFSGKLDPSLWEVPDPESLRKIATLDKKIITEEYSI